MLLAYVLLVVMVFRTWMLLMKDVKEVNRKLDCFLKALGIDASKKEKG